MRNYEHLQRIFTLQEAYQQNSSEIAKHKSGATNKFWQQASVSRLIYEEGFRPVYPGGKKFAACISHDMDLVYNHNSIQGNLLWGTVNLLKGNTQKATYHLSSLKKRKLNDSWTISHTLDILDTYQVKSSFYFLALDEHERDFNYKIEQLDQDIHRLREQGHEVGLHGGHDAFDQQEKMQEERDKLEKITGARTRGYRSHFLNLAIPTTWHILQKCSFSYDASLGFSREIGFRNGMCYPFRPYLLDKQSWMDFFVLPLQIMDVALFLKKHVNYQDALNQCKKIIDENASMGGVCTLLWHNNYMQGEMGKFFREVLSYLHHMNAWMPTSLDLINWWKKQSYQHQTEKILSQFILDSPNSQSAVKP